MNMIYIDTTVLEDNTPVFGIVCSGTTEETFSHEIEAFQHPIDSQNSTIIDDVRIKPLEYNISFFISDSPQTLREQIEFLGNEEFWKGLIQDEVRAFEETTLINTGLRTGSQNSFSSFVYETLKKMQGYQVTALTGTGELKNMILLNINAQRNNQKKGMTFNLSLTEIYRATKETSETKINVKDSSLKAKITKPIPEGPLPEVPEEKISDLGNKTGVYK